ncbi:MAG: hypothetical protein JXA20_05015 [Spirochaetes bacterium]|nr:hypothetical protein [Spirochaetota bacterium]
MVKRDIDICRPGSGASCALCCGSHNFRAEPSEIGELFRRRAGRVAEVTPEFIVRRIRASRSDMTGSYYFRDPDCLDLPAPEPVDPAGVRCPFVGCIGQGIVGCLLYPSGRGERRDCLHSYGGKHFTCGADESLDDDEVLFAARLTGHWYHYSVLIQLAALLRRIMGEYRHPESVPLDRRKRLFVSLEREARENRDLHRIHGYFR